MLKAAFYQVEQCQEPPEEIRAEMQEFAADVGLGFHAFYMDSPKPWYLSEPSSKAKQVASRLRQEFGHIVALHPEYYRLHYSCSHRLSEALSSDHSRFLPIGGSCFAL